MTVKVPGQIELFSAGKMITRVQNSEGLLLVEEAKDMTLRLPRAKGGEGLRIKISLDQGQL